MPDPRNGDRFLNWLGKHEDEGSYILPGGTSCASRVGAAVWSSESRPRLSDFCELGLGDEPQDADGRTSLPIPKALPDPSIPRWLWELADLHGYEICEKLGAGRARTGLPGV